MASEKEKRTVHLYMYDARLIAKVLSSKLKLGLTPDDITNPTSEVAIQVFTNFVRFVLDVSETSLTSLPLTAQVDDLDYESHRKTIPLVIVYQCLKAFVSDNSGKKLILTMCDFVNPAAIQNRFKKVTSFLVDFIKLHGHALPIWDDIRDEFSDRKHEVQSLQNDLVTEEKRKNALLSQQSQRKRREHELINEHNKVNTELTNVVGQYTANMEEVEERKKKKEEAYDKIERLTNEIISGRKMVEHLGEEVLSSPEELKNEMAMRKKQIEELREHLAQAKKALQEKDEAVKICTEAERNEVVFNEKLVMWDQVREDIVTIREEINENLRALSEYEEKLKLTIEKRKIVGERMREQSEQQEEMREQHSERNKQLQLKIDAVTEQIAALGKNQPDVSRDIEKKRQELLAVKNMMSEKEAECANSCRETLLKLRKMETMYEELFRVALEKRTAADRAACRVKNACAGVSMADYTFNTESIDENNPPPHTSFKVFN